MARRTSGFWLLFSAGVVAVACSSSGGGFGAVDAGLDSSSGATGGTSGSGGVLVSDAAPDVHGDAVADSTPPHDGDVTDTSSGGAAGSSGGSGGNGGSDAGIGDCCSTHATAGCSVPEIKDCVCELDGTCCVIGWNVGCITQAISKCGIDCGDAGFGTGGTTSGGTCCFTSTSPGCGNATIEACVCAQDGFCCSSSWDSICVGEVTSLGCGTC